MNVMPAEFRRRHALPYVMIAGSLFLDNIYAFADDDAIDQANARFAYNMPLGVWIKVDDCHFEYHCN